MRILRWLGSAFVGLTVVLVTLAVPDVARAADDYPAQWRNAAQDSVVDSWGYYNRECTSFVAWALQSRNGFEMPRAIGNANSWKNWAQQHGYAVDMNPAPGAVAWWSNQYGGHVAWVKSVNGDGTVTVEDYNNGYPQNPGTYMQRIIAAGSAGGYIHFKDLPAGPPVYTSFPPDGVRFTRSGQQQQYLAMRGAALPISYPDAVALDAEGNRALGIYNGALPPAVMPNDTIIRPAGRQNQAILVSGRKSPIRNTYTAACLTYSLRLPTLAAVVPPSWADSLPTTSDAACSLPDHTRFTEPGSLQQSVSVRGAALPVQYGDAVKYEAEGLRAFVEMPAGYVADPIHAPSRVPNNTMVRAVGTQGQYLYRDGVAHPITSPQVALCMLSRYPQNGAVAVPAGWLAPLPRGAAMSC